MTWLPLALVLGLAPAQGPEIERWVTEGYGYLLEVERDELRIFEHRALGDLPVFTATRLTPEDDVFVNDERDSVALRSVTGDEYVVEWGLTSHPVVLVPTDETPRVPIDAARTDPVLNFEWFCATFEEHYAFFEERGVDWAEFRADHRGEVGPDASDEELFDVLSEMMAPLQDGHCSLRGMGRTSSSSRPDPDEKADEQLVSFRGLIDEQYLTGPVFRACEGRVVAGLLAGEVGYLRIDAMEGLDPTDGYQSGLVALGEALDRVFRHFRKASGLVIDARFNGGGEDTYGLAVIARLVSASTFGVAKEVRSNPADSAKRTLVGTFEIEPTRRPGFRGPVALLTSRYTASAAEVFAMALLEREPRVTVVGEPTMGIFSDILVTHLPNGWTLGLSNEIYTTRDGRCFEAVGVPVDVELPTLRVEHLEANTDPALEAAVEAVLEGD